jgi:hypothetical protein
MMTQVSAQTTATDFDVIACSGTPYNLFSKMDQGKIVVLAWVMPCSWCILDPVAAYAITEGYAESHPDKIDFIIVDDYANTSCGSIDIWVAQYGMENAMKIVNAAVSMSDYGVDGMPKIVLLSGDDHQIYYNENSSTEGFQEALDLAVSENDISVGVDEIEAGPWVALSSFPNPSSDVLNVAYVLDQTSKIKLEVVDLLGSEVLLSQFEDIKQIGSHEAQVDVTGLPQGAYLLRISSEESAKYIRFIVSE